MWTHKIFLQWWHLNGALTSIKVLTFPMRTRDGLEGSWLLPTLHIEYNSEDHVAPDNKILQYVFSLPTLWKSVWWVTWELEKGLKHGPCLANVLAQKRRKGSYTKKLLHKILHDQHTACMCGSVSQSCLTLYDPVDYSPPGSSVHWISQARILERLPFPLPGNLPNPRIKHASPALQADSLPLRNQGRPLHRVVQI